MSGESPERDPRATAVPAVRRSWATSGVAERQSIASEPRGSAPAAQEWSSVHERIIADLYAKALAGEIPANRPLKEWEPDKLNERHLAMVMMRASGVHQRMVAKAFGATDSNVSIILNHPVAEYILSRLLAMKATQKNDVERRLEALSGPAVGALEDLFTSDDKEEIGLALKRMPAAFKILEANGKIKPKQVEGQINHNHTHRLDASPEQLSAIGKALAEAKQLRDPQYVDLQEGEVSQLLSAGEVPELSPSDEVDGSADVGSKAGEVDEDFS